MREKVRPKMGKIDIDYQKLHDAFFRWQVKPKMTIHGDLYYEVMTCSLICAVYYMGLDATKPVFVVSNKVRFKPVSSATETS